MSFSKKVEFFFLKNDLFKKIIFLKKYIFFKVGFFSKILSCFKKRRVLLKKVDLFKKCRSF